jgi:S-adenosylmethionine/arginine decarboxylase-like enzyme
VEIKMESDERDHCWIFGFDAEDAHKLRSEERLKRSLEKCLDSVHIDTYGSRSHKFIDGGAGVTSVTIIGASCADIHTWPEYGTLILRCFACGDKEHAVQAFLRHMLRAHNPAHAYEILGRAIKTQIPSEIPSDWVCVYQNGLHIDRARAA